MGSFLTTLRRWLGDAPAGPQPSASQSQLRLGRSMPMGLLLNDAFAARSKVSGPAQETIRAALRAMSASELVAFDMEIRRAFEGRFHEAWLTLSPGKLQRLPADARGWAALAVASMHRNGRVREEAVRRLGELGEADSIGLLLIRANDWVSSVRSLAVAGLQRLLPTAPAETWVHNLPLVFRLEDCGRADHRALVDDVLRRLGEPASLEALGQGLFATSRSVRQACGRVILGLSPADSHPLLVRALNCGESSVRANAADALLRAVPAEALPDLAWKLQGDPFMPVRRAAIEAIVGRAPSAAVGLLRAALLDCHAGIREQARFHLTRAGAADFRQHYLSAMEKAGGHALQISVLGLGETGAPDDFERILPLLESGAIPLRKAALQAATRLDACRANPHLLTALGAESPGVSRLAARLLETRPDSSAHPELLDLFQPARPRHVRRNAFRLLASAPKWKALPTILIGCADRESGIQGRARTALGSWLFRFNRVQSSPTAVELAAASEALRAVGAHLSRGVRDNLASLLATMKPDPRL